MTTPYDHFSRKDLLRALLAADQFTNEIIHKLLATTLVAHWRAGEVSVKAAALACRMTEDNFKRAVTVVDNEARRMLVEALAPSAPERVEEAKQGPDGRPQVAFDVERFKASPSIPVFTRDGRTATFARIAGDKEEGSAVFLVDGNEEHYWLDGTHAVSAEPGPLDLFMYAPTS